MKTYTIVPFLCVLVGCAIRQPVEFFEDQEPLALRGAMAEAREEDGRTDAGDADGGAENIAVKDGTDAAGAFEAAPAQGGALRSLSMRMTGMDDAVGRFAQFRVGDARGELSVMFVIHQGLNSGTYSWALPNALLAGEAYTLDFFIDQDEDSGRGAYDQPPRDHAWRIEIPAGQGAATLEFANNTDFVDIERDAPTTFRSTVLASRGMGEYEGRSYDVRVTERSSGRLVGRQLREVPGDTFDLRVSGTTQPEVEYVIDVVVGGESAADAEAARWQLIATAAEDGLRATLDSESPQLGDGM